ncbi:MAG: twin-arginine translocase subunit TatC [Myxococcales bacterium]|nr:twin-arginine translocase subunit TatC [Myxococcales bacterium]
MTEPQPQRGTMPFRAHLVELRSRMLRVAIALGVGFFVAWGYHVELYDWLSAPVRNAMADNGLFAIKALQITESISVYMKLSLVGGLFAVSPYVFYQIWGFIAPGLLSSERRMMTPVIVASAAFFIAGALFCYAVVLPFMTNFLIQLTIEPTGMTLEPTLHSTMSYSMWLLLAFGVIFELPVFMYFFSALGLFSAAGMWAFYRYWVVVAFVIGAILTPTPDPLNQALMSGPLVILYGIGVGIAWLVERDRSETTGLPIRGALVLMCVLIAAGAAVHGELGVSGDREPTDDIPRDVTQLVGVHRQSWPRLRQQLASADDQSGLGMLSLLKSIDNGKIAGQTIWLARFADSVAVVVAHDDPMGVVKRVAASRKVSLVPYSGGQSAVFTLPGDREHWRVCAPKGGVLWLGHDRALARLARVHEGRDPALLSDPRASEQFELLRTQGPLFSLTVAAEGKRGWLPEGALSEKVNLIGVYLDGPRKTLRLMFHSKGFDSATALHDRLQVWTASQRHGASQTPAGSAELQQVVKRLSSLALGMSQLAEANSRLMPDGSPDQVLALRVRREALVVVRELDGIDVKGASVTTDLARLAVAPSISEISVERALVTWKVEAHPSILVRGLLAPSRAGFDPKSLLAPNKGKKSKGKIARKGKKPKSKVAGKARVPIVKDKSKRTPSR